MQNFDNEKQNLLLMKLIPDMKTVSVFMIVSGVVFSLTLVGMIAGIPLLFAGIRLKNAAINLNNYIAGNNLQKFNDGFVSLKSHFRMMKFYYILLILAVPISAVLFVFILQGLIYAAASLSVSP